MNNIFTFAKSIIRNNPGFAVVAMSLDTLVGIVAATVAWLILNMVNFEVTNVVILIATASLAIMSIVFAGYGYMAQRGLAAELNRNYSEYDED